MKATEQYFPVILFIVLYKVVYTFDSLSSLIGTKATEQYGTVVQGRSSLILSLLMKSRSVIIQIRSYRSALSSEQNGSNFSFYSVDQGNRKL